MSDPFSVTGSAVGVVSIGIAICKRLLSFYQDWRSYESDLDQAAARAHEFMGALQSLRLTLQDLSDPSPNALSEANSSVNLCENAIQDLEAYIASCRLAQGSKPQSTKLPELAQRLRYPFKKRKLGELKDTANHLQRNLTTLLHILLLEIHVQDGKSTSHDLCDIRAALERISQNAQYSSIDLSRTLLNIAAGVETIPRIERSILGETQQIAEQQTQFRQEMLQLLSKPSFLEAKCDEAVARNTRGREQTNSELEIHDRSGRSRRRAKICTCDDGTMLTGIKVSIGPLSAFYNSSLPHRRSCPQWSYLERTDNIGFAVSDRHLRAAIQVGMSVSYGAGALSISPLLLQRGLRRSDSPAFRVISNIRGFYPEPAGIGIGWMPVSKRDQIKFDKHLDRGYRDLQRIFNSGEARPEELDEHGNSLLHVSFPEASKYIANMIQKTLSIIDFSGNTSDTSVIEHALAQFFTRLLSLRVPVNTLDESGSTVLSRYTQLQTLHNPQIIAHVRNMEVFLEAGGYFAGHPEACINHRYAPEHLRSAFHEDFEFSPIIQAIVLQSEDDLAECLSKDPSLANKGLFGGNKPQDMPLYVAVDWVQGLRLLMGAIADARPEYLSDVVECALGLKNVESLRVLLEAGCDFPTSLHSGISLQAYRACMEALRSRRILLRQMAYESLPEDTIRELQLDDTEVVDGKAVQVGDALQSLGIPVNKSIQSTFKHSEGTVYHDPYLTVERAEAAYQTGFRDIDCPNSSGETPVMCARDFELLVWFVDKGARLFYNPKRNAPYALFHALDGISKLEKLNDMDIPPSISSCAIDSIKEGFQRRDRCSCACSLSGCTAISIILRHAHESPEIGPHLQFLERVVSRLALSFEHTQGSPQPIAGIIRSLTFTQLGLSHTCCQAKQEPRSCILETVAPEEALEIRTEERELIEELEVLVGEFVTKFDEHGVPIFDFIKGYWRERMHEYWSVDNKPDEDEVRDVVDLGIGLEEDETRWQYAGPMGCDFLLSLFGI